MYYGSILSVFPLDSIGEDTMAGEDRLCVIWSSGDREVALKMVFMYTYNAKAKGWWNTIRFVIWGPSAKLLAGDDELKGKVKDMIEAGIEVLACKACADSYPGVIPALEEMGVDVKYMGVPLTEMLKDGWHSLTF
jgi:hypothetical protein